MENKHLIHRLSRIQGQIEALKNALANEVFDEEQCVANLQLLKASINGLKKFGAAYMSKNIHSCLNKNITKVEIEELTQLAINTGFDI